MSDLERAQEWLGCGTYHDDFTRHYCPPEQYPDGDCPEATRLAALLAEVRAEAWDEGMAVGAEFGADAPYLNPLHANPYRADRSRDLHEALADEAATRDE